MSQNNDLAVLIVFFSRPETLKKVFEQVKKAKPAKLFLACDGARDGNKNDIENIEKCKAIVERLCRDEYGLRYAPANSYKKCF